MRIYIYNFVSLITLFLIKMEMMDAPLARNYMSVVCVVLGFDGEQLKVLLQQCSGEDVGERSPGMKLPGSMLYQGEGLDDVARCLLFCLTGRKKQPIMQFKTFAPLDMDAGSPDAGCQESATEHHPECTATVAYLAIMKPEGKSARRLKANEGYWVPLEEVPPLPFAHDIIIHTAYVYARDYYRRSPDMIFKLLPKKFTANQLRNIINFVYCRTEDIRNFHKKIARMNFVMPLEEKPVGVAHRAARFYRFDRKKYNRTRGI